MKHEELKNLLAKIRGARIGIVGDFCLDAYLLLEPDAAEISLETGLMTNPVRSQRYSLGGAGNVANNLRAMGVMDVSAFGVIGQDPFGGEMKSILQSRGIGIAGLWTQRENWDTHVYMKPYQRAQEQRRLDFGNFNQLHPSTAQLLLESLKSVLPRLDVVIINQQVLHGIHTTGFITDLCKIVLSKPDTLFIADSRHFPERYNGAVRKLNVMEAAKLEGKDGSSLTSAELETLAGDLYNRWSKPVFLTRGEYGCVVFDQNGFREIPGLLIVSPTDPVGAGDSILAGIAAALGVGADSVKAAELGTLVAAVTVQKLLQTGTASPEEILEIGTDPDHRYRPDLARDPRSAIFHPGTGIEIVSALPKKKEFSHVIFDHDGTLSTLRQGWEGIMEPMMVKAILGDRMRESDEAFISHVRAAVRDYIDKTTGLQTLVQMKALGSLVRQFKCVPENQILDESGYKKIYGEELLAMVQGRVDKLRSGERQIRDFTIRNAPEFVSALHGMGLRLYLASGTDQEDLMREAEILGYRKYFGDRMYGSVGDITKEAKRLVLERILRDIGSEAPDMVLTFGDGPVEMRETHKRGGYAVGVASDEVLRQALNPAKRKRLIEAGADLIVPDFGETERLLDILFTRRELRGLGEPAG